MDLVQVGSVVVEARLLSKARACIGLQLRLDESSKLPVVKALDGGQTLIKLPSLSQPSNAAGTPLIYHLATLANTRKVQFEGKIESISNDVATLRLDVLLPEWIVDGTRSLPKTAASAQLLLNLIPLPDPTATCQPHNSTMDVQEENEDADRALFDAEPAETRSLSCLEALKRTAGVPETYSTTETGPEVYSLRNLVMSIPTTKETPPTTEVLSRRFDDTCTPSLAILPEVTITHVMKMLDSESLQAIACTCKFLRHLAAEIGPCLKLNLYPHQRSAIRWMLHREKAPSAPLPHPTVRLFSTSTGENFWGNTATGETQRDPPPQLFDFRGGFFCDEPGLGKTITILSLILRTKGAVPDVPSGVDMTWFTIKEPGRRGTKNLGFYTISNQDADSLSKLERTKSTTGVVRRSPRGKQGGNNVVRRRDDILQIEKEEVEEEDEGQAVEPAGGGSATKRQRVGEVDASTADALLRRGSSASKETDGGDDEMEIDLTTPPPKAPELAAPSSVQTTTTSDGSGGGSDLLKSAVAAGGGGGSTAALDSAAAHEERVNNQWGREVRRHMAFTTTSSEEEQDVEEEEIDDAAAVHIETTTSEEAAADDADDGRANSWLQCDCCSKWRRIPVENHPTDGSEPWCCYQHPLPGWRSCAIRCDDVEDDEHLTACPGFVGFDEEPGLQENVEFFRSLLDKYKHLNFSNAYSHPNTAMSYLIKTNPQKIAEIGFCFNSAMANVIGSGFGHFLADIGFEPAPKKTSQLRGLPAQKNYSSGGGASKEKLDYACWIQPLKLAWRLVLDQKALAEAIRQGPKPKGHRIYLSPATLIVVPTDLIKHWKDQISKHIRSGALRVAVYDSKGNHYNSFSDDEPPLPQVLAWDYDVVITTFNKMSSDWKSDNPLGCSPLTQVHWLRIILDEGHTIGASLSMTSRLQMATSLRAERRWVMTGTPAPSTPFSGTITLKYMQPLLRFLHDEVMGGSTGFYEAVDKQLKDCPVASRWRLQSALKRCLIRASKTEILGELKRSPPRLLEFTPSHATSYNYLVELAIANMLLCDWYDPDHTQSLLSDKSTKRATQYLKNLGQGCNIAGNIALQVSSSDLHSCLESVAAANAFPPPTNLEFGEPFCGGDHPLRTVEEGLRRGGTCNCCGDHFRVVLVSPCACLLCVHCAGKQRTKCVHCSKPYVMQSVDDPARKKDDKGVVNPNPKWDVPQQFIEWQPAFAQFGAVGEGEGSWQEDWEHAESSKLTYLMKRLRQIEALPPANWDPNDWGSSSGSGSASSWPPSIPKGCGPRKAIIFTQHAFHYKLLINKIKKPYPEACVRTFAQGMKQEEKDEALLKFGNDPLCCVLIMDELGSHGHDLSFVQHVFIMEPIENKSLEEQVVSRAYRLGVKEQVHVEMLAMRGTYEELVLRRNGGLKDEIDDGTDSEEEGKVLVEIEEDGASEEQGGNGSVGGSGSKRKNGSGDVFINETKRQQAAGRMERNTYLRGLQRVRVG